jgi:hypothetical protein
MSEESKDASSWLLGTWRSDKERSLQEWLFAEGKAEAMKPILERDLGKLVHHFSRTLYETYSPFEDRWFRGRYRVVWSNEEAVFIVTGPKRQEEGQLIRFLGPDLYWVHAGKNIEYFARLSPAEAKRVRQSKSAHMPSADA